MRRTRPTILGMPRSGWLSLSAFIALAVLISTAAIFTPVLAAPPPSHLHHPQPQIKPDSLPSPHSATATSPRLLFPRQQPDPTPQPDSDSDTITDPRNGRQFEPVYMRSDGTRSTSELLITCLATYVLCIWRTLHLSIPPPPRRPPRPLPHPTRPRPSTPSRWERFKRLMYEQFLMKSIYSVTYFCFPEWMLWASYFESQVANGLARELERWPGALHERDIVALQAQLQEALAEGRRRRKRWPGLTHVLNRVVYRLVFGPEEGQGGLKLTRDGGEAGEDVVQVVDDDDEGSELKKLGFYALMGGFVLDKGSLARIQRYQRELRMRHGREPEGPCKHLQPRGSDTGGGGGGSRRRRDKHKCSHMHRGDFNGAQDHFRILTVAGVLACAELGCLPHVSIKEIHDKSKVDGLGSFLVVAQLAWMLVQVIGRVSAKLPVTLLEVHICAQCLIAGALYALWWDKPVDVEVPTRVVLNNEKARAFVELQRRWRKQYGIEKKLGTYSPPTQQIQLPRPVVAAQAMFPGLSAVFQPGAANNSHNPHSHSHSHSHSHPSGPSHHHHPTPASTRIHITTYFLTSRIIIGKHIWHHISHFNHHHHGVKFFLGWPHGKPVHVRFLDVFLCNPGQSVLVCLVSLSWVAVHAGVWNDAGLKFDSPAAGNVDMKLFGKSVWRGIVIVMASLLMLFLGYNALGAFIRVFERRERRRRKEHDGGEGAKRKGKEREKSKGGDKGGRKDGPLMWMYWKFGFVTVPLIVIYMGVRLWLIITVFVRLNSLPKGSYTKVRWQEFVPHL